MSRIRIRRPMKRGMVAKIVVAKRALADAGRIIRGLLNDRKRTAPAAKGR